MVSGHGRGLAHASTMAWQGAATATRWDDDGKRGYGSAAKALADAKIGCEIVSKIFIYFRTISVARIFFSLSWNIFVYSRIISISRIFFILS